MKKAKLIIISASLVCILITVFIMFNFNNPTYQLDTDSHTYIKNHMTYSNASIIVKNPDEQNLDFINTTDNSKNQEKINIPVSYYPEMFNVYENKVVYKVIKDFFVSDLNGENKQKICSNANSDSSSLSKFSYGTKYFAYTDELSNVFAYSILKNENMLKVSNSEQDILQIEVADEFLYILSNEKSNKNNFIATEYNISSNKKIFEYRYTLEEDEEYEYMIVYDKGVILKLVTKSPVFIDCSGNEFENKYFSKAWCTPSYRYAYDIVGNNFYYVLRNYESNEFCERTIKDENNGLYRTDLETGETKKLSNICDYDEILATENFVYAYKTNYLIPKSIIKGSFTTGYDLQQIPIK